METDLYLSCDVRSDAFLKKFSVCLCTWSIRYMLHTVNATILDELHIGQTQQHYKVSEMWWKEQGRTD